MRLTVPSGIALSSFGSNASAAKKWTHHTAIRVITVLAILLATPACLPQTAGIPDSANVGAPINEVSSGGSVDSVQLNNGNLHVDIPLLDLPGLGIPIHIHLIYDNKVWNYANEGPPGYTYIVEQDRPLFFISYPGNVRVSSVTTTPIVDCGTQAYPDGCLNSLAFVDQNGTAHTLNGGGYYATSPPCDYAPAPIRMYAADSSGIVGDRAPNDSVLADAILKDGTKYTFLTPDAGLGPIKVEDSDGNALTAVTSSGQNNTETTTITDTIGRVFTIVSEGQYGYQPVSVSYTDQNGAPQTISISYTAVTKNLTPLCFGNSNCQINPPTQAYLPSVVTLQDGSTYSFVYTPNSPGDLQSLTLRTGGVISWTYGQTDVSGDKVLSRTVAANGQKSSWQYTYAMSPNQAANSANVVTVTDPSLNDTQYTCTIYGTNPLGLPGGAQLQPCYMTKEQAFNGLASGGSVIVTKTTSYGITGTVLPKSTIVSWAATGQVSETDTSWDSIPNSGYYSGGDTPANDVSRGNVTGEMDYDYASGAHGALLKNVQNTYLHDQNSAYVSPNIVDRLYQQSIYNSATVSPATLVSQTTTSYDQFNQASINGQTGLTATTGTTNHDYSNFSTAATLRGLPTSVSRYVGSGSSAITTYTDYNDLGMKVVTTDGRSNSAKYAYGTENAFVTSTTLPSTNGVTHIDQYSWDANTGNMTSHTNQNNVVTKYFYNDPLGRQTLVDSAVGTLDAGGQSAESKTSYTYQSATETDVAQDQFATGDGVLKSSTFYDGLGRAIKTVARDGSVVETAYDGLGRVCAVSNPTFNDPGPLSCVVGQNKTTGATDGYTYFLYDPLGRKAQQTQPDGNTQRWRYNGSVVDFYDEDQSHWQQTSDALGRLTKVLENDPAGSGALSLETDYTYDTLNNLISVNQKGAPGNTARYRTFLYDSLSRLTNACNPEAIAIGSSCTTPNTGAWSAIYSYDANGNVSTRTDARGIATHYSYDALNRLIGKTYTNDTAANTPALSFGYDQESPWQLVANENNPVGHLNWIMATLGTTNLVTWTSNDYDQRGNLLGYDSCLGVDDAQGCPGVGVAAAYSYNLDGTISGLEVVAGGSGFDPEELMYYGYDSAGRLNSITSNVYTSPFPSPTNTVFSGLTYYPGGAVKTANLAVDPTTQIPGIALSRTYDNRGRVTGETDTNSQQQIAYNYSVNYDGNGNVTGFNDSAAGTWTVNNDALHRLWNMSGTVGGVAYTAQEAYDNFGNRNVETVTAGSDQMQPSSYLNFTAGNNRADGGMYDYAGNPRSDGANNYLYDAENRICAVQQIATGGGGSLIGYLYDPNGTRLGKNANLTSFTCDMTKNGMLTSNGLALTSLYTAGPQGEQLEETDGSSNLIHFNVFWEGKVLGSYSGATYAQTNWHFALNDWVGTKRVITNSDGTYSSSFFSGPFGDFQTPSSTASDPSEHHFTGKERDIESGLDYFSARYYNSYVGRFMSPDYWGDDDGPPDPTPYGDLSDPQSLNLYGYVRNNPLSRTDPDGHDCIYNNGDGTGSVQRGDCTSDTDSGVFINGTIDVNSFKYNAANNSSSFSYATESGGLGTGLLQGPDLNGGFDAGSLAAGVFGAGNASTFNNAFGVVNAAGNAELAAAGFAFPLEHLGVTLLSGNSPSGVQQAAGGIRRKPGSLGEFGSTARENKIARDISKALGLGKDQEQAVHTLLQEGSQMLERPLTFKEGLEYVGKALGMIE